MEIRPSVSSTLIASTPGRRAAAARHVDRRDARLIGGIGLDGGDQVRAGKHVGRFCHIAGGIHARHRTLHLSHRRSRPWRHAPASLPERRHGAPRRPTTMTTSQGNDSPVDKATCNGASAPPSSIRSTPAEVRTRIPLDSTQRLIMPPAAGVIMRGTMRSPISTTVSSTPREASACMMMQPMKPAPSCSTRLPGRVSAAIARASSSVQQVCVSGRSMPGIGGRTGCEPVAISSRS